MLKRMNAPSVGFADSSPASGGAKASRSPLSSPVYGGGGAKRRRGQDCNRWRYAIFGFSLVLASCSSKVSNSASDQTLALAVGQAEDKPSLICRPENFQGCCSYNDGIADKRTGKCRNGATSPTCNNKWKTSLRGRCSWNDGVASVDAAGNVYCNNKRTPGPAIPKCEAE